MNGPKKREAYNIIKNEAFKNLINANPILEPVVDILVNTINDKIESQIKNSLDKITNKTIEAPVDFQKIVKTESLSILEQTPIFINEKKVNLINNSKDQLLKEEQNILVVKNQLKNEIELKINEWIAKLTVSDKEVREKAVDKLISSNNEISQKQINKIFNIMEHSEGSWQEFLYREQHCNWYEKTSKQYYAAKTISNLNSSYVSIEKAKKAKEIIASGKNKYKVMDPGWV